MTTENALSTRIWLHILLLNWYLVASLNVKVSFLIVKAGCLIGYSPSIFLKKVAFIDGNVSGSHKAKIGEVGLAHRGILFFDELPHFSKSVLEALREPLQDNKIRISRVNSKVEYPSDFLFVAAMNPCPCGNLLHAHKECRCNELDIQRYKNRLSDPFLDRIDLCVVMQQVTPEDKASISSREIHAKVVEVLERVKKRGQKSFTAKLSDAEIEQFCIMDDGAKDVLQKATMRFGLSLRAIKKIQKVSRTIADLRGGEIIEKGDVLEALSYRRRG